MSVAKTSRDVTKRLGESRFLLSALWTQGPEVARLSLLQVRPHLVAGDREPDFHADLVGLGRQLQGSTGRLERADESLYEWNAEVAALGGERRTGTERLRSWLVGLRRSALGQFVEPDLIGLGLEKHTARDTDGLLRQAGRVSETFLSEDVDRWLGESLFPEATFDPKVHGRQLAELVAGTHELMRSIDQAKRRRDEALLEKREAMKEHDRLYLRTARMFEELCRHAGKDELAERVRPSARRSGRRAVAASEPIVARESREEASASKAAADASRSPRLNEGSAERPSGEPEYRSGHRDS